MTRPSGGEGRLRGVLESAGVQALVVLAVLVAAWSWVVPLSFQMDDFQELPKIAVPVLGLEGEARAAEAPGQEVLAAAPLEREALPERPYLFRPILWLAWAGLARAGGAPLDPRLFHAASLVLHALVALILLALLRHLLGPWPALVGTLLFSVQAGGAQAVSFVSAGGDVLVTLFGVLGVLAALRARRGRALAWWAVAGAALAAAIGSKITGFVLVPILAVPLLLQWRARPLRWRLVASLALLLPAAAVTLLRQLFLQTWSLSWAGGTRAGPAELWALRDQLPAMWGRVLLPWNQDPLMADLSPWAARALDASGAALTRPDLALTFLSLPLLALVARPRSSGPRLLVAALLLVTLSLPALVLFPTHPQNSLSRAFYPLLPVFAYVAGLAAQSVIGWRGAVGRWLPRVAFALAAGLAVDALVHVARTEHRVAGWLREARAEVERSGGARAEVTPVVIGIPFEVAGIPYIGHALPLAFRPPFTAQPRPVLYTATRARLETSGLLHRYAPSMRILVAEGPRLQPVGEVLPAIPEPLPPLERVAAETVPTWVARGVPCRALGAIEIDVPAGPRRDVRVTIEGRDARIQRDFTAAESPGTVRMVLDLEPDREFVLDPELRRIRLVQSESPGMEVALDGLLPDVPALEVVEPASGVCFASSTSFRCRLAGVPDDAPVRFRFELVARGVPSLAMVYQLPAGAGRREGESVVMDLSGAEPSATDHPLLSWERLDEVFVRFLAPAGEHVVRFRWRAEALTVRGRLVRARSAWRWLEVRGRE